jgi:hypothetical protein
MFSTVVDRAKTESIADLCKVGSLNCVRNAQTRNADQTRPTTAPVVVASWDVPDSGSGDAIQQGGRLLEVCGVDGQGKAYQSQMLFFGSDVDHFTVFEPTYWTNMTISNSLSGPPSASPGLEWASCPSA